MDPKRVIVNFQHIDAHKALQNIVEQCGIDAVMMSLSEIEIADENMLDALLGLPILPIKFGSSDFYRQGIRKISLTKITDKKGRIIE